MKTSLKYYQIEERIIACALSITTGFLVGSYGGICIAYELTVLR